jgi:hypothetical protein
MLPVNKNVTKGQANALQVTLEKVVLKPNVQPETVMTNGNVPVQAVRASQVDHVVVSHSNDRVEPQVFSIEPRSYTFDTKVPKPKSLQTRDGNHETLRMKATQLLVIVNDATMGHKLQGSSVYNLFIHCWSNVRNWDYVMLSRVRTRNGLFLREAISKRGLDCYAMPPALQRRMM